MANKIATVGWIKEQSNDVSMGTLSNTYCPASAEILLGNESWVSIKSDSYKSINNILVPQNELEFLDTTNITISFKISENLFNNMFNNSFRSFMIYFCDKNASMNFMNNMKYGDIIYDTSLSYVPANAQVYIFTNLLSYNTGVYLLINTLSVVENGVNIVYPYGCLQNGVLNLNDSFVINDSISANVIVQALKDNALYIHCIIYDTDQTNLNTRYITEFYAPVTYNKSNEIVVEYLQNLTIY